MRVEELLSLYHTHQLTGKPSAPYYGRLIRQIMGPLNAFEVDQMPKLALLEWYTPLKITPGHANKALGVVRAAFRWGIGNGVLTCSDPTIGMQKCPERMRSVTTSPQEWALIAPILEDVKLRHRVYFWSQYLVGGRPGETRRWKPEELHLDQAIPVRVNPCTKNGRPHVQPIPSELVPLLKLLLYCNPPDATWLFWGQSPTMLWCRTSAQKMWEWIRAKARLKHLWLNDLRRSTASDLLNQGESLGIVQGQLGHRSLSQTAKYAWLAVEPLAAAMQRRATTIAKESVFR